jgi:hypothetical protein
MQEKHSTKQESIAIMDAGRTATWQDDKMYYGCKLNSELVTE